VHASQPIGVFDSGIGGLSVLRALRAELPHERFVYFADNGHAPYGERDAAQVLARARTITTELLERHDIKALVIACNTATAVAIHLLRAEHPGLPIIGVEPALKPAAALTRTRRVGVMATRGTLESAKFAALLDSLCGLATFILQPCDGLADAIERQDTQKS
jgi:glutamate racemase